MIQRFTYYAAQCSATEDEQQRDPSRSFHRNQDRNKQTKKPRNKERNMAFFFFSSNPLPILLLLLLLFFSCAAASSTGNATIYDVLAFFDMPPGIFPDSVTSFSLHRNGSLHLTLSQPCYRFPPDYLLYYDRYVKGYLCYDRLAGLSGIQIPRYWFFWKFWYNVDIIKVDQPPTDYIYFDAYYFVRRFLIAQFSAIQPCHPAVPTHWTKDFFANLYW